MKAVKQKNISQENLQLSDSLAEAFNDVASAVNDGALELQRIDDDIKALQVKLKSLNFQGMEDQSMVEMSDSEELSYDYNKKDFFYKTGDSEGRKLLTLPIKIKKQIHEYYLPELLGKISNDYKQHRAAMA